MPFEFDILFFIQSLRTETLDKLMVFITSLGQDTTIWVIIGIAMLFFKRTRKCGILMLISMAFCDWLNEDVIKHIFVRVRPCNLYPMVSIPVRHPHTYSFPSGHAFHSFVSAAMIHLHFRKTGIAALALAALIAFSRVYLFVHFPTDIYAGTVLGILFALMFFYAFRLADYGVNHLIIKVKTEIKRSRA